MYQVLARKYRPRNFIELVGQNHVSRALTSALERGRLHHAYLFTGTRGVGKTTIARILAKCLNCETGVTSTPCEVCPTCTAVNEGRFIDLIEIDAASRTKVEDTRELLDNVPYAPTQGRFKVYLIDEVHMLSTHSFNALLKTLEEPPEHVKFLFATTDPQKLPITVISRCLQFTLRPLAVDEITHHLTDILAKEQIAAEQDAIWQIAESAQGSLRDALSLTDQAIAYGQGAIQHQDVKEMLGLIDRTIIFDLILAVHQNQQQRVSQLLMQFRQQALDVSLVLDQFISTLHELALLQYLPELSLKYSAEINQKIMQLSALIAAADLQLYYQVACKGRADLQMAVTQEQGFEMCILRLLAFRPLQPNEVAATSPTVVQVAAMPAPAVAEAQVAMQTTAEQSTHIIALVAAVEAHMPAQGVVVAHVETAQSSHDDLLAQPIAIENDLAPESQPLQSVEMPSEPFVVATEQMDSTALLAKMDEVAVPSSMPDLAFSEPSLTLFGDAPLASSTEIIAASSTMPSNGQDVFFLTDGLVEDGSVEDRIVEDHVVEEQVVTEHFLPDSGSTMQGEPNAQPVDQSDSEAQTTAHALPVATVELNHLAASEMIPAMSAEALSDDYNLMPQDILRLTVQPLEGDWNIDQWEYWFRNSELSPALQELAQQGLMQGQINGTSVFSIAPQYEQLFSPLQATLEAALLKQWPNTQLSVDYHEPVGATPFDQQAARKQRAFQRAEALLQQDTVVKALLQSFDAELQNIQLKP